MLVFLSILWLLILAFNKVYIHLFIIDPTVLELSPIDHERLHMALFFYYIFLDVEKMKSYFSQKLIILKSHAIHLMEE